MESIISQIEKLSNIFESRLSEKRLYYPIIFLLIILNLISFLRFEKIVNDTPSIRISHTDFKESGAVVGAVAVSTSSIVSSKKGKKYYFLWCKGSEKIKEKNKIFFKSEDEAKKAGKVLGNGCV